MKIRNHRLHADTGGPVATADSPNRGGALAADLLVMHYTAGADAASAIATLTDPASRASAHLVIARDGAVTQLVPFNRIAWHAGRSRWPGRDGKMRTGLNRTSIGIELDNAGRLTRQRGRWRSWFGAVIESADVIEAPHRNDGVPAGWQVYPAAQIAAAIAAARAIRARYGIQEIVGHDDIAPGRKSDPGPAFPMESFRAAVMGRADDAPEVFETTAPLNVRAGPGADRPKLAGSPLPPATRVEVLEHRGSWRLVDVLRSAAPDAMADLQGWVHGRYLQPAAAGEV